VERLFHTFKELGQLKLNSQVHFADPNCEDSCLQACYTLMDSNVDGLLVLASPGGAFMQVHAQMFQERRIPIVTVAGSLLTNVTNFAHDIQDAYEKIGQHLLEERFRSITLMFTDFPVPHSHQQKMLSGFRNVQERARLEGRDVAFDVFPLPVQAELSEMPVEDIHELYQSGYVGMKRLIEGGHLPEALMCQVDNVALGALRACGEAGIRVPEDIAITGFGNFGDSSSGYIPITTVSNDLEQICHLAIEKLHKMIKGESRSSGESVTVPGRLIVRRSTKRTSLGDRPE
jgi:DNA-binding LacI/PurR family transcriptional regulator